MTPERCDGMVLAAGAGTRYGMPKALAENGAWLRAAVRALREGGCARVFVVLGATGPAIPAGETGSAPTWLVSQTPRIPVPPGAHPVWAADWATGVSASLRAGLAAVAGVGDAPPEYVAIMPVDTPDVGPDVVRRVIDAAQAAESGLARAFFGNVPGHPVVLGRGHWADVLANATGNYGAGTYLQGRADMVCVTCDDLATGIDRDYPCGTR
ncbi:NTP transferase domain-containing protein [Nocardia sp. SYP-A9097]|uniref:nucleotidyltransferase family protein n=1 Tax=Nocardia sp. SYP-A9097 TaxID=2663237 RepID=UPI00129B5997|nr:nucleotidyltransferase family protein [Nocardia sp. SYP-A9097]MRH87205.1 NTP transferase domain-containing protein [Nocardia sp. SYP-A9097]